MASPVALAVTGLRCEHLVDPLAVDTPTPRLSWQLASADRGVRQHAYQIIVASTPECLAAGYGDVWDSGIVESDETLLIAYGGPPLTTGQEVVWSVRSVASGSPWSAFSAPARWRMGVMDATDWTADWVGSPRLLEAATPTAGRPGVLLRHEFELPAAPRRAVALVSALGAYDLHVNGERVGDDVLAPEWTDYDRRIQYQAIDVTGYLGRGANAIGALVADGWFAGRLGHVLLGADDPVRGFYGDRVALLLQLDIDLVDGTRVRINTDENWRTSVEGPLVQACLMDGEHWDARREQPGWDRPAHDDASWLPAAIVNAPTGHLVAQRNEPIRPARPITPIASSEPAPGRHVFDLGQNIAGRVRLRGRGVAGRPVTVRHGEMLQPDGTLYRENLRFDRGGGHGAAATDVYVPARDGDVEWEPRFTYHGFRFVEVEGLDGDPGLLTVTGVPTHSDVAFDSSIETSDPQLNRLLDNASWTLRGNLHGIPTDCPQRDERLGFLGDMLAFGQSACFTAGMGAFFTKWLADVRAVQTADGRFPDFAPHCWNPEVRFSGTPGWADGGALIPLIAYRNYADRRLLEESFESARRWVDLVVENNPDLLWRTNRGMDFGDWLNAESFERGEDWPDPGAAEVPKEVFATAFLIRSARAVAEMARILDLAEPVARYDDIAAGAADAFAREFVGADGLVEGDSQAGYALALHLDLVPDAMRPAVFRRLLRRIDDYGGHLSTGFHTTPMLMSELVRGGRVDVAYDLLLSRSLPSWGFMIDNGATTMWERWDGWVRGRGFQRPVMNSFSHYAFGAVVEWVWNHVVGIQLVDAGWSRFRLQPRPGGGLTSARGAFASPRGRILSEWRRDGAEFVWEVVVPPNTTAELRIPVVSAETITEGGLPITESPGLSVLGVDGEGATLVAADSGHYRIRAR